MEFIYNIWSLLCSPNTLLTNTIILPFLLLFENFLALTLISTTLNKKIPINKTILYVLTTSTIGTISTNLLPIPFNILFNFIFVEILLYKLLNLSLVKSLFFSIFLQLVFCILEALISNPYATILGIITKDIIEIPIYRILYNLIIYICLLIIIFILKIYNFNLEILEDINQKNKLILLLHLIFGFFTTALQCFLTTYYTDILPINISFLNFIVLIGYFYLSFCSFIMLTKLHITTKKLQSAEEYNNNLQTLNDNIKSFKHDFDNILTIFGGYIKNNDMKGLKQYYTQFEEDYESSNNLSILSPKIVNNDGIYNLLTKKYHKAISKNIKMHITFLLDLSTLKMKIYEFDRVLGILLDNAIEASSECDTKIVNLIFRNDSKRARQLIIIENTYKNKNVDTEKIFQKGFSGKKDHTGIGLWQVRKIIKKYNNINLFTSKTNELFTQQLEIYY